MFRQALLSALLKGFDSTKTEDFTWVVILPGVHTLIITCEGIMEGTVTNNMESWEYGAVCITSPRGRVALFVWTKIEELVILF